MPETTQEQEQEQMNALSIIISQQVAKASNFQERRKLSIWYDQFRRRSKPLDEVKGQTLPLVGVLWYDAMIDLTDAEGNPTVNDQGESAMNRQISLWLTKDGIVFASWSPVTREYTLNLIARYTDRFEGPVWVEVGDQRTKSGNHTYFFKEVEGPE